MILSLIIKALKFLFGIWNSGQKDIGKQKAEAENAQQGLKEVERATNARDQNRAAVDADPNRLSNGGLGSRPYEPGPDK